MQRLQLHTKSSWAGPPLPFLFFGIYSAIGLTESRGFSAIMGA
jgi:hypothetical protein